MFLTGWRDDELFTSLSLFVFYSLIKNNMFMLSNMSVNISYFFYRMVDIEKSSEDIRPNAPELNFRYRQSPNTWSEELEDTNGVIRIRKWKNRKHNGQKKKYKQRSTKHTYKTKDRVNHLWHANKTCTFKTIQMKDMSLWNKSFKKNNLSDSL